MSEEFLKLERALIRRFGTNPDVNDLGNYINCRISGQEYRLIPNPGDMSRKKATWLLNRWKGMNISTTAKNKANKLLGCKIQ